MKKKMILYEIGKDVILLWNLASVGAIGYGLYKVLFNAMQLGFNRVGRTIFEMGANTSIKYVKDIAAFLLSLIKDIPNEEALHNIEIYGIVAAVGIISLIVARDQLVRQERRFKRRYLPYNLPKQFTNITYEPKKRRSVDEPLCELGLLRNYERYYTANSLQANYLGCPVSSEEIICGGVYGTRYTSYKVKVRGQWLTIHLDEPIRSTVILEARHSRNRLIHSKIAKTMVEIDFSDEAFRQAFRCFAEDTEVAAELLTRDFASKLLEMREKYPDFFMVFEGNCMYVLVRRKSFDRRLECLLPYTTGLIRREGIRLYGTLRDFTEMLMSNASDLEDDDLYASDADPEDAFVSEDYPKDGYVSEDYPEDNYPNDGYDADEYPAQGPSAESRTEDY